MLQYYCGCLMKDLLIINKECLAWLKLVLVKGPIHFNCSPNLTISLDDGAPKKALTLKINTSGYQMIEGSLPLA